ncbi:tether containing UBX domain for GLUT4 isoform X2 [Procambarus clarkii]|uniref:tether containing UBX domain for GLUT4 isoform X2 n=1 Tax=Procambarus clarkii TaxID=6728 RepID=UPI001E678388|nr:tether containing UBX domain for GLUT4-like isoform X2 [Procambarus clarkii]
MAASSVTVLCPNGRRPVVKVTPNTSILQIIEDACKKESFDPDQYKLKHLHRMLDVSSTVRYAGLPNKCQLELIKTDAPRTAETVIVNVATDSGQRLIHDFPATTTLWEILSYHEVNGNSGPLLPPGDGDREPVIVYTMRRIRGEELRTTSLKALGILSGKCMLRYSIQSAHSNSQAHVSAPLSKPKASQEIEEPASQDGNISAQPCHQREPQPVAKAPEPHEVHVHHERLEHNLQDQPRHHAVDVVPELSLDLVSSSHSIVPDVIQSQKNLPQPDITVSEPMESPAPMDLLEGQCAPMSGSNPADHEPSSMLTEETVIKLGSHDAILFSMGDAPPTHVQEEDETFFELSVNEVKNLYQEQQKIMQALAEAPIMTQQMREMEKNAKILSALNKYPVTQLRIHFPDDHVIQASFKSAETVANVMDFLRPFLVDPTAKFNLHTRHPPRILSTDLTLVAAECVPNARIYFGSTSGGPPYLNSDTLAKKSSFSGAYGSLAPRKQRRQITAATSSGCSVSANSSKVSTATERENEESHYSKRTNASNRNTGAVPKLPKWFKKVQK